jgi:hypothetical protein
MKIRFQADADFNEEIIMGVIRREPGIVFQTATEANLRGLPDTDVLVRAAQENRVLISHDRRTMPVHLATFIKNHVSPGVFLIAQNVSVRTAIDELLWVWACSESEEWTNRIVDLPL